LRVHAKRASATPTRLRTTPRHPLPNAPARVRASQALRTRSVHPNRGPQACVQASLSPRPVPACKRASARAVPRRGAQRLGGGTSRRPTSTTASPHPRTHRDPHRAKRKEALRNDGFPRHAPCIRLHRPDPPRPSTSRPRLPVLPCGGCPSGCPNRRPSFRRPRPRHPELASRWRLMTARILSGSSAVTAPRRERPRLGASHRWWVGMAGHVRCSRQPVALAAPTGATRPLGRGYPLVFADSRSDAPGLTDTRLPVPVRVFLDMGLSADGPDIGAPRLPDTRPLSDMGLPADPRSDMSTPRFTDMRRVSDMALSADASSWDRARHLADTGPLTPMCLSASTRTQRGRVHPLNALAPTPASGPRFARKACIEDGLSAPKGCMQETSSAPASAPSERAVPRRAAAQPGGGAGCLSFPFIPVSACPQGPARVRSAPEGLQATQWVAQRPGWGTTPKETP
jgi:hypothetical protein